MLGGSLANLNIGLSNNSGTSIGINPNAGLFVADAIAVGASLPIGFSASGNSNSSYSSMNFGLGAFGRYYFVVSDPISFFGGLGIGFTSTSWNSKTTFLGEEFKDSGSSTNENLSLSAGAVYFLNESIGVEGTLNLNNLTNNANLNLNLGFQIYFNRSK